MSKHHHQNDEGEAPDARFVTDMPDPLAPPTNDDWAARREAAVVMRQLVELMSTTTSDAQTMRAVAASLREQVSLIGAAPQIGGRAALSAFDDGRMGTWAEIAHETNPLGGQCNPVAPPLAMWLDRDAAHGRAKLGWQYEGPPSTVHGGFVCALFDHFLGMAQRLTGQPGVTGTLTTRFHHPTPLNTELELHGRVAEISGRKNILHGEIRANGIVTASCEGIFIHISKNRFRAMAERSHTGGGGA